MFKVLRVSNTSILMANIAIVSCITPASAQGFDVNQINNTDRMASKTTVIVDPNATRAWGYRVTSGAHTTSGWEKSLTDGDPNLRHWTWVPITNYDQKYIKVVPGAGLKRQVRPSKQPTGGHYIKPTKVALPKRDYSAYCNSLIAARRSNSDVSGRVMPSKAVTPTYAYAESGRYSNSNSTGLSLSSQDVYGKLVSRGIATR
jgi:hypothetical protein